MNSDNIKVVCSNLAFYSWVLILAVFKLTACVIENNHV